MSNIAGGARETTREYEGDDLIASYHDIRPDYPSEIQQQILERVKRRQFMLDVGCGGGKSTGLFLDDFENILGIVVSESQITYAQRNIKNSNVTFEVVHDNLLPVDSNGVDLVFCGASFHYLNAPTFFKQCDRVLLPGGILACAIYGLDVVKTLEGKMISDCTPGSKMWKLRYNFGTNCRTPGGIRDAYLDKYESTYRSLKNPTKEMLPFAEVDAKYTTQMFVDYFSTVSGYMNKVFEDPEKDPLMLLRRELTEMLEGAGMDCEDDTEFIVTFRFTAMVVEKTAYFGFA